MIPGRRSRGSSRATRRRRRPSAQERLRLRALYREDRRRAPAGRIVAGVDEVGRGPLAGPVFAGAVILGPGTLIAGLDDSKRLTAEAREALDAEIRARAVAVAVGEASVAEIDRFNILGASLLAMRRAVDALVPGPQFLLVDGRERLPGLHPHATVVRGDALCASIAAASIVAKVARDRVMCALHDAYPGVRLRSEQGIRDAGASRRPAPPRSVPGAPPRVSPARAGGPDRISLIQPTGARQEPGRGGTNCDMH